MFPRQRLLSVAPITNGLYGMPSIGIGRKRSRTDREDIDQPLTALIGTHWRHSDSSRNRRRLSVFCDDDALFTTGLSKSSPCLEEMTVGEPMVFTMAELFDGCEVIGAKVKDLLLQLQVFVDGINIFNLKTCVRKITTFTKKDMHGKSSKRALTKFGKNGSSLVYFGKGFAIQICVSAHWKKGSERDTIPDIGSDKAAITCGYDICGKEVTLFLIAGKNDRAASGSSALRKVEIKIWKLTDFSVCDSPTNILLKVNDSTDDIEDKLEIERSVDLSTLGGAVSTAESVTTSSSEESIKSDIISPSIPTPTLPFNIMTFAQTPSLSPFTMLDNDMITPRYQSMSPITPHFDSVSIARMRSYDNMSMFGGGSVASPYPNLPLF